MPLAFACILGGMNTAIGTPPNIIISEYKASISSSGFNFFDFSYVGLVVTIICVFFIAFIGNRLIFLRKEMPSTEHLIDLKGYLFEVLVNEKSSSIGMTLYAFKTQAGEIVVYPKHGVGEIINIENMEISNIKTKFYVVKMEQSKLTIRVPLEKQIEVGLRKISSKKIIEEVFEMIGVEK